MQTTLGAQIVLIDTLDKLQSAAEIVKDFPALGLDVETAQKWTLAEEAEGKAPIDFNRIRLRSIQFGDRNTVYVLDCALVPNWTECELFVNILSDDDQLKLAHNKNFEYKAIYKSSGVKVNGLGCTMQAERILYLGLLPKPPSLAELTQKYCGIEMEKDVRDTFITEQEVRPLREEQILYAANDVDPMLVIWEAQEKELIAENLLKVCRFEWQIQRAFADIELRGVYVDMERWMEIYNESAIQHAEMKQQLYQQFRADAVVRWERILQAREAQRTLLLESLDTLTDPDEIAKVQAQLDALPSWYKKKPNREGRLEPKKTAMWHFDKVLTSAMQMKEVFALNGIDVPDTNERTLLRQKYFVWYNKQQRADYPAKGLQMIDQLLRFRELDKRLSTYGPNWMRYLSPITNRLHCEYDTLKETARTGCQRPNIQNVPKRGDGTVYRTAFVPGPGNVFVVADYSQIELRVAADMSGDQAMIDAFTSGADFHTATAAKMFNVSLDELAEGVKNKEKKYTDMRRAAKSVNFGIIFGIGAEKLAEQITFDSGTPLAKEEAAKFLQLYRQSYPVLTRFLKQKELDGQRDLVSFTELGHRRQFHRPYRPVRPHDVKSPAYKKYMEDQEAYTRRMGGIGRECKNTPIQGTAACIAKRAILKLETILPKYNAGIVAFIHDEIVVECPIDEAEDVLGIVSRNMRMAGKSFLRHVEAEVDAHIGMNWLADEEVDLDSLNDYMEETE